MRMLACFLAAEIGTGARQNIAQVTADTMKLTPQGQVVDRALKKIAKVENEVRHELADLPLSVQNEPKYSDTGLELEFGQKKQGSHSIRGELSVSMDSKVPKPAPDETGHVPAHGEVVLKTDSEAQARMLVENINHIIDTFLGQDMMELKQQLPKLIVEGNSIKLKVDHLMKFDEEEYTKLQAQMKAVTRFAVSHDIYLDLDMWIKNPALKLLEVFTGMKGGVTATVAEEILTEMANKFEEMVANETAMEPVKGILGADYQSVIEKVRTMLKGNVVTIPVPGFDKMKEQMAQNPAANMTFGQVKTAFEGVSKQVNLTGMPHAVAALNLIQQAAAANLRFSSMSVSMYGGAVKVAWTWQGLTLFNTVARAAQGAGAEQLVYGDKKPEEYNIPGVISEGKIEEIAKSGAFTKSFRTLALAMVAALMSWVM